MRKEFLVRYKMLGCNSPAFPRPLTAHTETQAAGQQTGKHTTKKAKHTHTHTEIGYPACNQSFVLCEPRSKTPLFIQSRPLIEVDEFLHRASLCSFPFAPPSSPAPTSSTVAKTATSCEVILIESHYLKVQFLVYQIASPGIHHKNCEVD